MCYQEHGEGINAFLSVGGRTGVVTFLYQERLIQISLYVVAANETSPAGKLLPDVVVSYMVVLAGTEAYGINFDQLPAARSKPVPKDRQECRRCMVSYGPAKTLPALKTSVSFLDS